MFDHSQIILSTGMPRSASTWLYNTARLLLLENCDPNDISYGWIEDIHLLLERPLILLKLHDFELSWCQKSKLILYSYRDLRDVLASFHRKFQEIPTLELADYCIDIDQKWRRVAHLTVRYETMLTDNKRMIKEIQEQLIANLGISMETDLDQVLQQLSMLNYDNPGIKNEIYHQENLFHKNHITDGRCGSWENYLDQALVKQIEEKYHNWFLNNNYQLSS